MTLANFNHHQVESFVSNVFDSKVPVSSKLSKNNHYTAPQGGNQPSFGGHGRNFGGPPGNNYNNFPNQGYQQPPSNFNNANFNPPSSMPLNSNPPNNPQNNPQYTPPYNQPYHPPNNTPYNGPHQYAPPYQAPNQQGYPTEQPKQGKNLEEMNDQEFEGALDDFIKGLKDI